MWENTALGPGTKLPHILCAGIGLLQLGVVLVILISLNSEFVSPYIFDIDLLLILTHLMCCMKYIPDISTKVNAHGSI